MTELITGNREQAVDVYKLCRFWSYHRKCFLTYDEWIKESWNDPTTH